MLTLLPYIAVVALFALERIVLQRRPLWLAPLAIRVGKERRVPIDDVTQRAIVRLDTADGSYREAAVARTDWAALDKKNDLGGWLSDSEAKVELVATRALLVVRPRGTLGRNRGVWASFVSLDLREGQVALTQRFYLGDIIWLVVLAAAVLGNPAALVAPAYLVVRIAVTYFKLKALPSDLAQRLERYLAHDKVARVAAAEPRDDRTDEANDERVAERRAQSG